MEREKKSQIIAPIKQARQLQELQSVGEDDDIPQSQQKINLLPLLRTIRRKAVLIAGFTSLVAVSAVLLFGKEESLYRGNFQLLVEPITNEARISDPSSLTRANGSGQDKDYFSVDYPTQLAILQSTKILYTIVQQVQTKYPSFNYGEFIEGLVIERVGSGNSSETTKTKIIQVSYQNKNPLVAQFVLEKTAEKYLKYSLDERKSRISEGVKFIDNQTPDLQKQVNNLQSQLEILQKRYKLTDPKQNGEQLFAQTREITKEQSAVQRQLQEQISLYSNLTRQLRLAPDEAIAVSALSEDAIYQEVVAKLREVESQIAIESTRFTAESPAIQALEAKKQNLTVLLNQESQRILGQQGLSTSSNFQGVVSQNSVRLEMIKQLVDTANQIQMLQIRNQGLAKSKDAFEREAQQFPEVARQYTGIQQQLDRTSQTLNQLLSQRETLRVEAAQNQVPWELVSPPKIATNAIGMPIPDQSDNSKKLLMAVILGLGASILAAVLLEKYQDIFHTSEDLKDAINLPVLGEIPLDRSIQEPHDSIPLKHKMAVLGEIPLDRSIQEPYDSISWKDNIEGNEEIIYNNPLFLKAFDSLYASIRFIFSNQPLRALTICSACEGDGKSTIALHIAQTAADIGQRVLLVDANFNEPQIHNMLGLTNFKGLSDLLSKKMSPNDVIGRSPLADNLFVLTSGQALPNSRKILASAQMQYLMENFQATFDLVIYDTPHLSGTLDANFIAAHTDGILMVAGINKTKHSTFKQVINQLNTFGLQTLGVVANYVKKAPNKLNS